MRDSLFKNANVVSEIRFSPSVSFLMFQFMFAVDTDAEAQTETQTETEKVSLGKNIVWHKQKVLSLGSHS